MNKKEIASLKVGIKFILINMLWQYLEVLLHGHITPSTEDTIIGFILFIYMLKAEGVF